MISSFSYMLIFAVATVLSDRPVAHSLYISNDDLNNSAILSLQWGWLAESLFIYLFICWSSGVEVFLLCYHSIAPCTSKSNISASAICHPWGFLLIDWYICRPS